MGDARDAAFTDRSAKVSATIGSARTFRTALAIAVVVVLALVANTRVYFLRDYAGGTVLWNTSEAYFFLNSSRLGHSVSYYRYPWFLLKEFLGAVEPPDEEVASLVIVKVTANKIERHSLRLDRTARGPGSDPGRFTPVNGIVYTNCPMLDGLCRWAGDHFERATAEERGRIGDSMALNSTDIQEPIDGWSRREFGAGRSGPTFEIGLEGDTKISIKNVVGPNSQEAVVSIYVGRSDGTPGKIADVRGAFWPSHTVGLSARTATLGLNVSDKLPIGGLPFDNPA